VREGETIEGSRRCCARQLPPGGWDMGEAAGGGPDKAMRAWRVATVLPLARIARSGAPPRAARALSTL